MIPNTWTPHHRARDGELVGYLVPEGDAVIPVTLFGYPLAVAGDLACGQDTLEAAGLSCLAEVWRLQLDDGESIRVRIREAGPDRLVVIKDDFGVGGPLGEAYVLDVPETGRLSR